MCGIFGIHGHDHAVEVALLSLHALQHRGQEGAGISFVKPDGALNTVKDKALVSEISQKKPLKKAKSHSAIGHIRYATSGSNKRENVQPFNARFDFGYEGNNIQDLAIAHNGNLTNQISLKHELVKEGALFRSSSDTETILHLLARSKGRTLHDKLFDACSKLEGAYSLTILTKDLLIGVRDPFGFRPLFLGEFEGAYLLTSETCAFELLGAKLIKEILPGQAVFIGVEGYEIHQWFDPKQHQFCIFELIYFSRPDSLFEEQNIYEVRKNMGRVLATEYLPKADMVVPVPDSGVPAAMGYAEARGLPFELGITRNHYVGRTFIDSDVGIRNLSLRMKHNPNSLLLKGKKIILVDDSIVRGSTAKSLIKILWDLGVSEIHFAVSSPTYISPCFYGIDTPNKSDLLANQRTIEEIRAELQVNSLHYLSLQGLKNSVLSNNSFCTACFTGNYPTKIEQKI